MYVPTITCQPPPRSPFCSDTSLCIVAPPLPLPQLVDWYSVQRTADGQLFIVMQHCGINLKEHLKRHGAMSEQDARTVLTQLLQGVQHCHKLGVAHMDIGLSVREEPHSAYHSSPHLIAAHTNTLGV